jgi:hypothetical protein
MSPEQLDIELEALVIGGADVQAMTNFQLANNIPFAAATQNSKAWLDWFQTEYRPETNGHSTKEEIVEVTAVVEQRESTAPIIDGRPAPLATNIAAKMIALGAHVIFFPRGQKGTKEAGWQDAATRDLRVVEQKTARDPYANVGIVGKPDGVWAFDDDQNVLAEYESQHERIRTRRNRSVSGGTHLIFKQNDLSRQMGNISGKNEKGEETWSARQTNKYVVAAGSSAHPNNDPNAPQKFYECIEDIGVTEAPTEFIKFLQAKAAQNPKPIVANTEEIIVAGGRNNFLTSMLGKARQVAQMDESELLAYARRLNSERCSPPLSDSEVETVAASVGGYAIKPSGEIAFTQTTAAVAEPVLPEIDTADGAVRPVFPSWVLCGTSIYDNLVKPALESSSKHAEFIFIPAVQLMLNALSGYVQVGLQKKSLNMFVGLVSPPGKFFKSSSCELAFEYFNKVGSCVPGRDIKNADGKTLITVAGSSEGFGLSAYKKNAKRAILWNDELGKLAAKAGIESSSFAHDLLTWYEAGYFGNEVTNHKNNFSFDPGSYTFGWLWATTDRGFNRHWPKLAGISSGLKDRMFFVVSSEEPKLTSRYHDPIPQMIEGSQKTKALIEKAVAQTKYEIEDSEFYSSKVNGMDPRSMDLVEKLALYFCIDMGADVIDAEHISRALAVVEYRNQSAAFLDPIEADNQQGRLQKEIIRELKQQRGKMRYRDLCRNLDFGRYGLDVWKRAYFTMLPDKYNEGIICEWLEKQPSGQTAKMVGLILHKD